MNNLPSSSPRAVPSIRIHDADEASALFDGGEMFTSDMYNLYNFVPEDPAFYGLQSECLPPNATSHRSTELEDMPELSHLSTTYLTGHDYSLPYPTIVQESATSADGGLFPSCIGSPIPSPTSSFVSSLSPSSLHDSIALSDSESLSPSPVTPDQQYPWGFNQSSDSLALHPFIGPFPIDSVPSGSLGPQTFPQRPRSRSSPSRHGPVASKAMLEANSRRRRHPAQFVCEECGQTFTAQFSLKRHVQSHTGERPFVCSIAGCAQRFYNSSDCKRHEKSRKRHKDLMMA